MQKKGGDNKPREQGHFSVENQGFLGHKQCEDSRHVKVKE